MDIMIRILILKTGNIKEQAELNVDVVGGDSQTTSFCFLFKGDQVKSNNWTNCLK